MKDTLLALTLIGALYLVPAHIILKYGNKYQASVTFIPIANLVGSAVIIGQRTWKFYND